MRLGKKTLRLTVDGKTVQKVKENRCFVVKTTGIIKIKNRPRVVLEGGFKGCCRD